MSTTAEPQPQPPASQDAPEAPPIAQPAPIAAEAVPAAAPPAPTAEPAVEGAPEAAGDAEMAVDEAPKEDEYKCETLYLQNLNEKIKPEVMKATLRGLFKSYGDVLDVVAHGNLRMRGQAFVSFENADVAAKALREVQRFPLYSKPLQISFAKTRSDAVVKKKDPNAWDEHKATRDAHKKATRYTNPVKAKFRAKRLAADMDGGAAPAPSAKRPAVQMPDEYLPPNKILFLQNLPEVKDMKEVLVGLFGQYPNLYEVRLIPSKKDIAFVEFLDETSASAAKDGLHNYKLDGESKIKITFARK